MSDIDLFAEFEEKNGDALQAEAVFRTQQEIIPSPLNYTGSKFKLFPFLKKYLPPQVNCIWDSFCGGGSFFINLSFPKVRANDIISPLMEFYHWLQKTAWEEVLSEIDKRKIGKNNQDEYLKLRDRFNKHRNHVDFFMLVCSCTNNMMRFNKSFKFNQTWGRRTFNDSIQAKLKGYHERLYENEQIAFLNVDFRDCPISEGDFVYLDPPYLITEAGYNAYWSADDERALYDYIDELDHDKVFFMFSNVAEHKGKKNPYLRRLKKYNIVEIPCDYNKVSRAGVSNTKEILVLNY
jgi:DNA adenine methylase Dam